MYLKHIQMAELHKKYNLLKNGGGDMLQHTKGCESKLRPIIGWSRKEWWGALTFSLQWVWGGNVWSADWFFSTMNRVSVADMLRLCHNTTRTIDTIQYFFNTLYNGWMKHILISSEQQGSVVGLVGAVGVVLTSPSI